MLDQENKDKILKEEKDDKTLQALTGIAEALSNDEQLSEVITSIKDLVKVVESKKMPDDRSEKISIAIVSKFEEIHKGLKNQERANLTYLREGLLNVVKEIQKFHSEVADTYKKLNSINFTGVEKVMGDILEQMKTNKEAEHEMEIEYHNNGDMKKVLIKRIK